MLKKLDRYILKSLIVSFVISFFVIAVVMLIGDLVKLYDLLFGKGSSFIVLLKILGYTVVFLLAFIVPMALTIAINYVYSDLSNNSEITAIRSCGISLFRVYFPAFLFSVAVFVFLFYSIAFVAPKARLSYRVEIAKTFRNKVYAALKPNMFYDKVDGVMWIKNLSPDKKHLKDVFFAQKGKIFLAKKGDFKDIPSGILAEFFNVKMYSPSKSGFEYGSFDRYELAFLTGRGYFKPNKNNTRFMSFGEVVNYYSKSKSKDALYRINKIVSMSMSVFALSLIAFSFGITFSRSGKSAGIVASLFLFFMFYIILMLSESLCDATGNPYFIYLPNVVAFVFGSYIFYKKVKM
ncbi:LptF/LptG family permease [Hippea maritima]|uniref:Permease YjgP/YjgQ family protein n=1 Tax=Hippea maritima (strain ATCC 700847 / DSM 10411 / MH2) TaxID=760142 RepID=F2LUZ7_HIPMA|nr:LptF/LptG family permease [Hippea maritima]AEA33581.1 permease YjgP/YjgQ family protein [Hippea maritima DSM 10411]